MLRSAGNENSSDAQRLSSPKSLEHGLRHQSIAAVGFVPNVIPNCVEVVLKVGVARKSATTAAMMFVAAV